MIRARVLWLSDDSQEVIIRRLWRRVCDVGDIRRRLVSDENMAGPRFSWLHLVLQRIESFLLDEIQTRHNLLPN